jgi:uncharacterized membrane protein YdjX (TVP38/TMEM64 family)
MSGFPASRRTKRKLVVFAIVGVLLAGLAWYVNHYISLEDLAQQESRIRAYITANPWRSFVIGFGIYAGLALVPGTGGKAIVYGWLFGFWQAVIIVTVGLTLGGMAIFTLSRYLFQESIERRYTDFVSLMNRHLEKEGAYYLLALRMAHVPYSIVNPVSGASRVGSWTFCWTTALGLLPANAIWSYVGVRLPSLRELASSGPGSLIDPPLIATLVVCAALPHLVRWLISRFGIPAPESHDNDTARHESRADKT